jgi:hypothetical protein
VQAACAETCDVTVAMSMRLNNTAMAAAIDPTTRFTTETPRFPTPRQSPRMAAASCYQCY